MQTALHDWGLKEANFDEIHGIYFIPASLKVYLSQNFKNTKFIFYSNVCTPIKLFFEHSNFRRLSNIKY
jgi:hypothetical protein